MRSPLLFLHIVAGTLGMFSGFVAVFLPKDSRRRGIAGNVFVIAMLCLAAKSERAHKRLMQSLDPAI